MAARKRSSAKKKSTVKKKVVAKAPVKKVAAKPRSRKGAPDDEIVVRMYNVGFGDAFLVFVPTSKGTRKILFDCGSIKAAENSMADVATRIAEDVRDSDGVSRIDVVVATHRHKDHVSGFAQSVWDGVEVKEVWMPWTEDPEDETATGIRDRMTGLAVHLNAAFEREAETPGLSAAERQQALGMQDLALNALSNEAAMQTLHEGFAGEPERRFLPQRGSAKWSFKTGALPGITVHVLGPSRDEEVMSEMDPPVGKSYLRSMESSGLGVAALSEAFDPDWSVAPADFAIGYSHLQLSDADRERIELVGSGFDGTVAAALDKAVNGTSLMLVLEVGKTHLLFPGDAQWGTWRAALEDPAKRALLAKAAFYKIGHHGSHNATPPDFVEHAVGKDFWAMASTHSVKQWPDIPRGPLLDALGKRTKKIARSDQPAKAVKAGFSAEGDLYIEARIPLA